MTGDPALALTVALVLGVVFAAAAVTKLRALPEFAGVVLNYRLLPDGLVLPVAYALPVVELAAALALLHPATRAPAALVLVLLLVTFAAAMAINIRRGRRDIDCGCFVGLLRQRIGWALVVRNLLLAAAGLVLVVGGSGTRPLAGLDLVTIGAATSSFLALYAATGRLFGLAPARPLAGAR